MTSTAKTSSTTKKPSLKALQTKLRSLQSSFTIISNFVDEYKEDTTVSQISIRLTRLDDVWEKMLDLMCDVEAHDDFNAAEDVYVKERTHFEERYYDIKSFLLDKKKELCIEPNLDQSTRPAAGASSGVADHVRLPQIKLQTFDGNVDEWLSFRDLFTSLIHWKPELPEVEKLHYLKGCLEGEARSVIEQFKITKGNYQLAWDALLKRYNNSKLLKKRQVQSLFKLPSLPKESVSDLHKLLEQFERTVQTLDQLVQPGDYRDLLLIEVLSSHLDPYTRRGWEEHSSTKEEDTLKDLVDFVQRRIRILESLPPKASQEAKPVPTVKPKPSAPVRTSNSAAQSTAGKCVECSETHYLHQCPQFLRMSSANREALLRRHSLCRNCLRRGHQASNCQSKFSCRKCGAKHHTLVCFRKDGGATSSGSRDDKESSASNTKPASEGADKAEKATEKVTANSASGRLSHILLATAVINVEDDDGVVYPARALLDSGAESNFITERLYQQMNVARKKIDITVVGMGQATVRSKAEIQATVKSRVSSYSQEMSFLVLPRVTANLPTSSVQVAGWDLPDGIELADPTFFHSRAVDLVLGIQHFFSFFQTGKAISLGDGLPRITESVFGWIITGEIRASHQASHITCNTAVSEDMESLMSRFWSCEDVGACDNYTPEQRLCEEQFASSFRRGDDGRYVVELPKNFEMWEKLGESKAIATRRLLSMERRLAGDANLRKQYQDFMRDYLDLGHMHKVDDVSSGDPWRCYLPHHAVIKESSTTTKLRVVFDASAKTSTGISLNDALLAGPVIQSDLRDIVLRSRMRQVMVVSDVEKMFRQINIAPKDMPHQCILYRFDPKEPIATYELSTVTYGTKSAPFLATRTLKQLADDERERFPLAARAVDSDVYMDDVISGANDVETATELRVQLDKMLSSGGFMLRKWVSNKPEVLRGIPEANLALPEEISWDQDSSVTTLGMTWLPWTDYFKYKFSIPTAVTAEPLTKRKVLSTIATFFDPLGLIGAAIIPLKIFMQKLWILRTAKDNPFSWDEPIPPTVGEEWQQISAHLAALNALRIPRCTLLDGAVSIEFHCFSDASEKAYGTCVYIRSKDASGTVLVRLLTSKSKVAPIKTQSLPRLELCGALLAAETMDWVLRTIKGDYAVHFWTDSTCVLRWLNGLPGQWHTFVANRVAKTQALSKDRPWNHVPGATNPADLISRGVEADSISANTMWWEGPSWLKEESDQWPTQPTLAAEEESTERKRNAATSTAATSSFLNDYLSRYSSFTTLIRATALAQRYISNLSKAGGDRRFGFLTTDELRGAEVFIIRLVQQETFSAEIEDLRAGKSVSRRSQLRWFNPLISHDGLLRVGGRLNLSQESQEAKQPIVLPARHWFTKLLLRYHHLKLLHAGPQLMLAAVRQRYWPLGGKDAARQIVHMCQRCYRLKPKTIQQKMGDLPEARVTISRPFAKTGVDYFGPVYIKAGRGRTPTKAYVAIFVCMAIKAVHMELVTDLSTECFLQALRRFISRRNRPTDIYCDNGTNFVGAKNKMQELLKLLKDSQHKEKVAKLCGDEGIKWHFNPPSAPHFGGLWEAAVRSAKHHLLRVLGENSVSFEDFNTLLTQVEACLNSRPLTAFSNDPTDVQPLTPGHFLTGESLQALPDPDYSEVNLNRLSRFQLIQRQLRDFWKRWRTEYLSQLQARTKNWKQPTKVEVGQLVVIMDNNQPPLRWKTGRVHKLHPGADGVVRVVTLRLASGDFMERPVAKLCILPSQDDESSDQPEPSKQDD